jgi:hypothetical protein
MLCKCGCGKPVSSKPYYFGGEKIFPKYISGHNPSVFSEEFIRHMKLPPQNITRKNRLDLPVIFCKCGCGNQLSRNAVRNLRYSSKARKRGFIKGHQNRGGNSYLWKGGRIKNHQGYILIKMPENPFCDANGYIREHRFIMEQHIGRNLKPNEEVHHINGINDDNRLENLVVLTKAKHTSLHHKGLKKPNSLKNLKSAK